MNLEEILKEHPKTVVVVKQCTTSLILRTILTLNNNVDPSLIINVHYLIQAMSNGIKM